MVSKTDTLYLRYPFGCSGYTSSSQFTGNVITHERARTWVRTPGFRKNQTRKIELPCNPYSDTVIERKLAQSRVSLWRPDIKPNSPVVNYYGIFAFEDPPQVALPTSVHTELGLKALGKIPSRINGTQFNLPLFMFEWHKTTEMVINLATDIANKLKNAKSRRQLYNMWLEYRYGWRLLVKDIYDGLCAVHDRRLNHSVMRVAAEATSTVESELLRSDLQGTRFIVSGMKTNYRLKTTTTYGVRYSVRFKETAYLGSLQQFGITNPIGLAWELIPYSFVIDWLIPVSEYLSLLDTWVGKSFVSGSVSYWQEMNYSATPYYLRDPLNPSWSEKPGGLYGTSVTRRRFFSRQALSAFPKPDFPSVQLSLNASRLTDAVSLMLQRRR